MIHHCDIVATPRRVTTIPAVPERPRTPRFAGTWIGIAFTFGLLASFAVSLGAQAPAATPKGGAAKGGAAAAPATTTPTRNISWTSSRRNFAVGDIIKVTIDEYALAEANKNNNNSAGRSRNMSITANPPSTGGAAGAAKAAIGPISGSIATGDAGQDAQQGRASRDTRYSAEIAARVVAVTPDGLLQVKGTKLIDVDKNKTTLTLSGFVRPIDVGASDEIGSDMIADAQIAFSQKGSLGKPKNGIFTKLVGILWP